ncbi:MAG: hypothetical protein JWQ42_4365 [Edaphobacter sp.]|nr:hypothetical protein [Edaphobacter sp.]
MGIAAYWVEISCAEVLYSLFANTGGCAQTMWLQVPFDWTVADGGFTEWSALAIPQSSIPVIWGVPF